MSKETIESILTAYFTNMAAMNPEGWIDTFAEDAVICDPVSNPPSKAHEYFPKFFGMLTALFEKLELSQDKIIIVGNNAAVNWTVRVVAKNGRNAMAEGISTFEINESGKIQKILSYWNDGEMMAQLKG